MGTEMPDEGALLARTAARDTAAFALLYDRHARMTFGYAVHVLQDPPAAEEVVLEAFLSLWREAASIDVRRTTVLAWLLTLVYRQARCRARRQ